MKKFLGLILMSVVLFLIFYGGKNQFTPDEFVDAMYEKFDFVHQDYRPAHHDGFLGVFNTPEVPESYIFKPKFGVTEEELNEKITIIGVVEKLGTFDGGNSHLVGIDTHKKIEDVRFSNYKDVTFKILVYGYTKFLSNISKGDRIKITLTWNNLIPEEDRDVSDYNYIARGGDMICVYNSYLGTTETETYSAREFQMLIEKTWLQEVI
ncbi:MAG: hypothetical protein KBS60_02450, partial [Phascolarctobacterium sp.]|nr:hypothetical protein [Candidatus Phascolarctobacterium caballi]